MKELQQIYAEMTMLFESFKEEHDECVAKEKQVAGKRARAYIQELKEKIVDYCKLSNAYCESLKNSK